MFNFCSQVLLLWDNAEVKRIVQTARWVIDRLGLVQGTKSMRSLVICFGVRLAVNITTCIYGQLVEAFPALRMCRVFLRL